MIVPIDFSRLQLALSLPRGWLELALTLALIVVAWLADRSLERRRNAGLPEGRRALSFVNVGFPVIAFALLFIASFVW